MTQQAARVSDPHTCPMQTPSPHIGGPILPPCFPTVLIGGQAAARIGDMCQCTGPVDMIRTGAPTVLIGGEPAARMGDLTRHGGVIARGFPTVLIGPLAPGDAVARLFSDEYLKSLIGQTWEGADSDALADAMRTLWEHRHDPNHPDVAAALQALADARGRPLSEIQAEWDKFQAVQAEQERIAAEKGLKPVEGLNEWLHPDFMGSSSQMRFGQVVGDAFGIDPAFGALLSPSGGLVGMGNWAADGDDSALGYHGAVHDAGGYLYNYHDQGPGYDYLGLEGRDTGDSLSGQRAGISYWRDALDDRGTGTRAIDAIGDGVMEGIVTGGDAIGDAYDKTKEVISSGIDKAGEVISSGVDKAGEVISSGVDKAEEVISTGFDKAQDVASDVWNWFNK
jgi:uncharacterized Zn-binding protein involved in type VI secretion